MKDNLILFLIGAGSLAGAATYSTMDAEKPKAAAWFQEGKLSEPEITQEVVKMPAQALTNKVAGEFAEPGNVCYPPTETVALGPPVMDDYPRAPKEIREVVLKERENKGKFGWHKSN